MSARWAGRGTLLRALLTTLVIALVVALLIVALVAVPLWRKRAAAVEPVAPLDGVVAVPGPVERGPPLPVVLVHGLFGFDRIGVPGARFDYFRGIAKHLED